MVFSFDQTVSTMGTGTSSVIPMSRTRSIKLQFKLVKPLGTQTFKRYTKRLGQFDCRTVVCLHFVVSQ